MLKLKKPVVKPEWIHDSILKGKIQDWRPYLLFQTEPDQPRLAFGKGEKTIDWLNVKGSIKDTLEDDLHESDNDELLNHHPLKSKNANAELDMTNKSDNAELLSHHPLKAKNANAELDMTNKSDNEELLNHHPLKSKNANAELDMTNKSIRSLTSVDPRKFLLTKIRLY
jgi:pterin-4a-carbinolamine dehydratase